MEKYLMQYAEVLHNTRLHNETLSHAIFIAMNGSVVAIWSLSYQFLTSWAKIIALSVPILLSFVGLIMTYRIQHANEQIIMIGNKIRKKLGLQDSSVKISDGKHVRLMKIFPQQWDRYHWDSVTDARLINREGMDTGKFTWWALYKCMYLGLIIGSLVILSFNILTTSFVERWLLTLMSRPALRLAITVISLAIVGGSLVIVLSGVRQLVKKR